MTDVVRVACGTCLHDISARESPGWWSIGRGIPHTAPESASCHRGRRCRRSVQLIGLRLPDPVSQLQKKVSRPAPIDLGVSGSNVGEAEHRGSVNIGLTARPMEDILRTSGSCAAPGSDAGGFLPVRRRGGFWRLSPAGMSAADWLEALRASGRAAAQEGPRAGQPLVNHAAALQPRARPAPGPHALSRTARGPCAKAPGPAPAHPAAAHAGRPGSAVSWHCAVTAVPAKETDR